MSTPSSTLLSEGCATTLIPYQQLLLNSLHILAGNKTFDNWSVKDHADSFRLMKRIAQLWEKCNITNQYLIYGKIDSNTFKWEMVPYQKCRTYIGRVIQQLQVLWRTIFGGIPVSDKDIETQHKNYQSWLQKTSQATRVSDIQVSNNDSFCKKDTIDRQWVIKGKKVNTLFNYAPIGFGGERLHFLVVPQEHREQFTDVTQEEYCEALEMVTRLANHFKETRESVHSIYLLNKTGVDAGQTVKHWHLHVVFCTNSAQHFWGKLTILKNILIGSSPMEPQELVKKVDGFRKELVR